jgi:hypothetical protein
MKRRDQSSPVFAGGWGLLFLWVGIPSRDKGTSQRHGYRHLAAQGPHVSCFVGRAGLSGAGGIRGHCRRADRAVTGLLNLIGGTHFGTNFNYFNKINEVRPKPHRERTMAGHTPVHLSDPQPAKRQSRAAATKPSVSDLARPSGDDPLGNPISPIRSTRKDPLLAMIGTVSGGKKDSVSIDKTVCGGAGMTRRSLTALPPATARAFSQQNQSHRPR